MSTITNLPTVKNIEKLDNANFHKSKALYVLKHRPKGGKKKIKSIPGRTVGKYRIRTTPVQGIIHIKCSLNNTIVTLTDLLGKTKAWVSCGSIGFKGSKRSSRFAGQAAVEFLGSKIKSLGYKYVVLHLNGLGRGRNVSVKGLKKSGLRIYFIKDFTSIAHNGCRPSKLRRL